MRRKYMGFWIMLTSFILGLGLLISGFNPKEKKPHFKEILSSFSVIIGIVLIGFAVYLAWPK